MPSVNLDNLKSQISVVEYALSRGVLLEKKGKEYRGKCPLCLSVSRQPFWINGPTWQCHSCGEKGDVIELCQKIEMVDFKMALERLEALSVRGGVAASVAPGDRARSTWGKLAREPSAEHTAYIESRDLRGAIDELRFSRSGIAIPLYRDGRIINVVFRSMDPGSKVKVYGMKGCSTDGLFGSLGQLDAENKSRVVIVEGLTDYLSARALGQIAFGAHGSGRLPDVSRVIASKVAGTGRDLVFVPDVDKIGKKKAGEAIRVARSMVEKGRIFRLDLPSGDLNDALMAGATGSIFSGATLVQDVQYPSTDVGNASRFVDDNLDKFRYVAEMKQWNGWNGQIWAPASSHVELMRAAIKVTGMIKEDPLLAEHAESSQQESKLKSMISIARSSGRLSAEKEEFDSNPDLLSASNGTIDLQSGKLRDFDLGDMITAASPIGYVASAKCPLWDKFLLSVFEPNPDAIDFIQRFAGYSLTGSTSAQCLVFLHGSGRNGKGVIIRRLAKILGKLAAPTGFDTFVSSRFGDTPHFSIATMHRRRVVYVTEGNERAKLNEGLIKQMTGGDEISACFKRKDFFTFRPKFKLWMMSQYLPKITGQDIGIWSRFKLVPFLVSFDGEHRDDHIEEKLDEELPGIFAWMIRGAVAWYRDGGGLAGLKVPESIESATAAYRSESDVVGTWLEEHCVTHVQDARILVQAAFEAYSKYVESTGERPMTKTMLGRELSKRGYRSTVDGKRRWYPFGLVSHRGEG